MKRYQVFVIDTTPLHLEAEIIETVRAMIANVHKFVVVDTQTGATHSNVYSLDLTLDLKEIGKWIPTQSGVVPETENVYVMVKFRDGSETTYVDCVENWCWDWFGENDDIVAYKLA
jgi:hypothetical protein